MECNKDEAIRAKEIAERKFSERDYAAAKKFALKAQNLYPALDSLSQMLTTFDVYVSAESKISSGEVNWYSVLDVNPWADDETVRKQYRKLALMLHPDKNKSLGADGAFKLVSEGWSLLSDKAKRFAYNQKLNPIVFQQRVSTQTKIPSTQPSANGFHNCNNTVSLDPTTQNKNARSGPSSVPSTSHQKIDTFWTICNRCKTRYEYLRIYLNHTLLCPNCHEPFLAVEKAPPPNITKSSNYSSRQNHQNSRHHTGNTNPFNTGRNCRVAQRSRSEGFAVHNSIHGPDAQWNNFSRMTGAGGTFTSPPPAAHCTNAVQKGNSALGVDQLFKKRRSDETCMNTYGADMLNQMATGNQAGLGSLSEPRGGYYETERVYGFYGTSNKSIIERELFPLEVRNMLMKKARLDICKKLEEWRSNQVKLKENKKQKSMVSNDTNNHQYDESVVTNKGNQNLKSFPGISSDDSNEEASAPMSINVPDPDFHNFDLDRAESSFEDDQVWAAYDEDDGMPRYYARIHKVISLNPFKIKISWLNSRSNSEFGPIDWVGSGFLKTCGDFRTGRHEISKTLNSFSHKIKWTKGTGGVIRILPKKGDIWALYRNWSLDWNEHTQDEVVHKYDMVEVLDDYNEEQGTSVIPLVKVNGFKTVFQRHMDFNELRRIPKEEMFRFSHQVPDHLLTGEEAHNAPKGCRELDPAAIPLELIQVIMEDNETQMVETSEKSEEEMAQNCIQIKVDQIGENASKTKEGKAIENEEQAWGGNKDGYIGS